MRKPKQKVTDSHVERVLALDALAGILNYQDMTKEEAQAELFAMGERGEKKPKEGDPLYIRWTSYTTKSQAGYDKEFSIMHRRLFPLWYVSTAEVNRLRFLDMQRDGCTRPSGTDFELFRNYTNPLCGSFSQIFVDECVKIENNWLPSRHNDGSVSDGQREELLKIALMKGGRPSQKTKLGRMLNNFVNPRSKNYHANFTKDIKRISKENRLGWFLNESSDTAKELLLSMARGGHDRPSRNTEEGKQLSKYLARDQVFRDLIRYLAPNWFKNRRK